jgi:hypothetical protein
MKGPPGNERAFLLSSDKLLCGASLFIADINLDKDYRIELFVLSRYNNFDRRIGLVGKQLNARTKRKRAKRQLKRKKLALKEKLSAKKALA